MGLKPKQLHAGDSSPAESVTRGLSPVNGLGSWRLEIEIGLKLGQNKWTRAEAGTEQ